MLGQSDRGAKFSPVRLIDLELDLDVFAGPFDLLLTLILREEVDLLEVDLAEIVISYIDHLDRRGELDLESATEFLVLIAALLELKSRLMLPGEEPEQLDLDPGEAAEELLARLLDAHRYRGAANHLQAQLAAQAGFRFRSAPLPPSLRRASLQDAVAVYDPGRLAAAIGELLVPPPAVDIHHMTIPKITVAERLAHLRSMLRRGSFKFDDAVASADRVTVAVTLFALLELYKQGEASWSQPEPFGEITVTPPALTRGAAELSA
ncbi:MAG: segregation and condensation protein [Solirubrobacteraceae bacterium]|nr:segregation and condensation protein [Solirubrobacteraceae bacterium]